jgi:NAD(P)-dependent dehydrogenase (short-subunit alcohol dehydrogenase family)
VNDLDSDLANAVVDEIHDLGGVAIANATSVTTLQGGSDIVQAAIDMFGSIHIVVNNAGQILPAYFEEMTPEKLDLVLDTHVRGAFFVTRPAWSVMQKQKYGRIVMTGSATGMFSHQAMRNYATAKGGLFGLMKALAFEGVEHGINVNIILPNAATGIAAEDSDPRLPGNPPVASRS